MNFDMIMKNNIYILLFSLVLLSTYGKSEISLFGNDSLKINKEIEHYIQSSADLINRNLDSAMYYAEQANLLIENLKTDSAKIEVYKNLGDVYMARGNFPLSLNYYYKAKSLSDQAISFHPDNIQIKQSQFDLLTKIGVSFYYQKNFNKSLDYYNDALHALELINSQDSSAIVKNKIRLFNNIAAVHIQLFEYDEALEYYKSALETNKFENDIQIEATLSNNIGICYLEKKDFALANYYFQRALEIRKKIGDMRGQAQCYNNIGKNYVYNGSLSDAKIYYLDALELGRKIGSKESILISLQSLASIYDTLGDYYHAFHSFKEYKEISDSLFNSQNASKIAQLEMQYKFDKQERLFDLELKRREAEKEKLKILYLSTGGALFFLLVTAILLIFLQRSKIKNETLVKEKLELKHQHIELEKQKLKEELQFKNRELATNVMYLLKKNEMNTNILEKLVKSKLDFKQENQKVIQEIINVLKLNQDKDVWTEFEVYFTQVHVDFYKRLNDHFPNLSSNEKKLCAFLRLNMTTKDISAITYQSTNSITVARSRLRKKLNIQGEDINLINFLMEL